MSTRAYVDLIFAWGHARLGDVEAARQLMAEATEQLRPNPIPIHAWLSEAFSFRIEEAIAGRRHGAPWPVELVQRLDEIDTRRDLRTTNPRYGIDRARELSRILEPYDPVDPYLLSEGYRNSPINRLRRMMTEGPATDVAAEFEAARGDANDTLDPIELSRFYVRAIEIPVQTATRIADRLVPPALSHALRLLAESWEQRPNARPWLTKYGPGQPSTKDPEEWAAYRCDQESPARWVQTAMHRDAAALFPRAIRLCSGIDRLDLIEPPVRELLHLVIGTDAPTTAVRAVCAVLSPVTGMLARLGLRDPAEGLADRVTDHWLDATFGIDGWRTIFARLGLTALNLWLGRPGPALAATQAVLPRMWLPLRQFQAACAYLEASVFARWPEPVRHARGLLGVLPPLPNTYTTAPYFSRLHLEITERLVFVCAPPFDVRAVDRPPSESSEQIASRREALLELRARP